MKTTLRNVVLSLLIGLVSYQVLPTDNVKAVDGSLVVNKQSITASGMEHIFNTGTVTDYKPMKFIDNLNRYPVFYLESKHLDGDVLQTTAYTESDAVVNTPMITMLAKMAYALDGSIMQDLSEGQRMEVYQALIWQELQTSSREDLWQSSSGNPNMESYMNDVYDLARTNVTNEVDLIPDTTMVIDETRAVYDKNSSGYIYYGPVTVKCDNTDYLSVNYSHAGMVLVDRIGGENLTKLIPDQNFYVRFQKDKAFTNAAVEFSTKVKDVSVNYLTVNTNKPNLIAIMPVEKLLTNNLTFESINNKATITVNKDPAISGFTYTLYTEDGVKITTAVTNASGQAVFNSLELGNYIVKETGAPDYYTPDETEYPVSLVANGDNITVNSRSVRQLGSIKISVLEGLSPVRGCTYLVYSDSFSQEVTIDGQELLELALGNYSIQEVVCNPAYAPTTDVFNVILATEGETQEVTISKTLANAYAEFEVKGYGGTIKANVLGSLGNKLTTISFDGSYRIGLTPGNYTLQIVESGSSTPLSANLPFSVYLNETTKVPIEFNVANPTVTISTRYNASAYGGVGMEIRNINNVLVQSVTSDGSGIAKVTGLEPGTYMVHVVTAPNMSFTNSATPFIYEGLDLDVLVNLQARDTSGGNSSSTGSGSGSGYNSGDGHVGSSTNSGGSSSSDKGEVHYITGANGVITGIENSAVSNQTQTQQPQQNQQTQQGMQSPPNEGAVVTNPYPTIDSSNIINDFVSNTITNLLDSNYNPTPGVDYGKVESGQLPNTGIEDWFDYRLIVSIFLSLFAFIVITKFTNLRNAE